MVTEELNTYIFSNIVMKAANAIRTSRVNAKKEAGEITPEQAASSPPTSADVKEALKVIRQNRKVVFDILAELESAQVDSPAPS